MSGIHYEDNEGTYRYKDRDGDTGKRKAYTTRTMEVHTETNRDRDTVKRQAYTTTTMKVHTDIKTETETQ